MGTFLSGLHFGICNKHTIHNADQRSFNFYYELFGKGSFNLSFPWKRTRLGKEKLTEMRCLVWNSLLSVNTLPSKEANIPKDTFVLLSNSSFNICPDKAQERSQAEARSLGLQHHIGLDFVACEQQSRRPACSSAQSDQRLYYSLSQKQYN